MKNSLFFFGVVVLFAVFSIAQAQDFVPGQIMIDIKHEYLPITPTPNGEDIIITGLPSIDSLNALFSVYAFETPVGTSSEISRGFYLLKFPDSVNADQVLSSYLADIHINMGSLNYIRKPHLTPSDYYFPQQWGLSKMKCPEAWRHTNGSPSIIIQIIDGGTDYGHPDLVHNVWQNNAQWPYGEDADGDGHTIEWDPTQNRWVLDPGDLDGNDDDYNGYYDDLVGWDFMNGDPDPAIGEDPVYPWLDHGDKTAGTAAAVTDNWISQAEATWVCWNDTGTVAGTSWFSKIMIARMWDDWDAIDAIDYGMNKAARIISMSWGGPGDNAMLHAKLDEAWGAGLLLIASAGNDSNEVLNYPAAYPNVIAVAATDGNDVKEGYSTYGTWVDICAPGRNMVPDRDNKWWDYYCYLNNWAGTSASAPFAAGVAAMVWSCNWWATNAQVRDAIINTADNIYGIPGNYPYIGKLGSGRVNALEAVKVFRPTPPPPGDCNADLIVNVGDIIVLINYVFLGLSPPDPLCVGNVNGDDVIDIGDINYLLNYLYKNYPPGSQPPPQDGCN